jgi:hypothetical protein
MGNVAGTIILMVLFTFITTHIAVSRELEKNSKRTWFTFLILCLIIYAISWAMGGERV